MNIKRKSIRFLIWWSDLPLIPFVGMTLLLTYIIMIPSIPFVQFFASTGSEFTYIRAISALTLAPLVETLIFQALVIYLTSKLLTKNLIVQVLISAALFGAVHNFSPRYILFATLTGIIFAAGYVVYQRSRRWEEAAWAIILVHFVRNSIALIFYFLLRWLIMLIF